MDDFASSLRQRRKFARWTQQKLAEELGVSKAYINHFESGKRSPSEEDARQLAKILGADEERWAFLATSASKLRGIYQSAPEQTSLFILDLQREAPPKNDVRPPRGADVPGVEKLHREKPPKNGPQRPDIGRRSASLYGQLLDAAKTSREDDKLRTD